MTTGRLRQLIEGAPAGAREAPVKLTLRTLDPITIAWLVARAGAFVKRGRRSVPAWGYAGLAKNLKRSRKVIVHPKAIERLLKSGSGARAPAWRSLLHRAVAAAQGRGAEGHEGGEVRTQRERRPGARPGAGVSCSSFFHGR